MTLDHLGSTRVVTDSTGMVKDRHDYLPFGEEIGSYVSGRANVGTQDYKVGDTRQKFTQKERDTETGLDYFGARYYSSSQGRFMSVDPIGINLSRMIDPQQLNKYAYVRNNSLKYNDPDGRDLKLDPKLKKADVERIFKRLVNTYRKQSGRDAIERMEQSKIPITLGVGKLPTKVDLLDQTVTDKYGSTVVDRTTSRNAKSGQLVGVTVHNVTITFDFQKRDDAQGAAGNNLGAAPPKEQFVIDHELGHVDRATTDPMGYETDPDPEKPANDFANKVANERDSLSKEEAEKRVREILGLPAKEEKKKKD